ncbi:GtrA family protein [Halobacteriales archaeon Cl-PHB]
MTDRTKRFDRSWLNALLSPRRFGQFVSVGAAGVVVDLTTLVTLKQGLGVPAYLAGILSIEAAILVMFLINEHWTFAEVGAEGRRSFLWRGLRSHAVRAAGSTTQYIIFLTLYYRLHQQLLLGGIDAWLVVAKMAGIAVGMVVNYTFESLYTWRVHLNED